MLLMDQKSGVGGRQMTGGWRTACAKIIIFSSNIARISSKVDVATYNLIPRDEDEDKGNHGSLNLHPTSSHPRGRSSCRLTRALGFSRGIPAPPVQHWLAQPLLCSAPQSRRKLSQRCKRKEVGALKSRRAVLYHCIYHCIPLVPSGRVPPNHAAGGSNSHLPIIQPTHTARRAAISRPVGVRRRKIALSRVEIHLV
jgi:hypothetical protein